MPLPPPPDHLPEKTRGLLKAAVDTIGRALTDNLRAVALVGPAARPERPDRARAPELVVVVGNLDVVEVDQLGRAIGPLAKQGLRTRLLTEEELATSTDVFTLEAADWRAHHHLLFGEDPFAALTWTREDLRRSLETNLRALRRRLRNRVLGGLARAPKGDKGDEVSRAIVDAVDALSIVVEQALPLGGRDAPGTEAARLSAFAALVDADLSALEAVTGQVRRGERLDVLAALGTLDAALLAAVRWIDAWEAAS